MEAAELTLEEPPGLPAAFLFAPPLFQRLPLSDRWFEVTL